MNNYPSIHLLAMVCVAALASCTNTPAPTTAPASAPLRAGASSATDMFQAVNAYRRSQGAKELQRHAGLDSLARKHCEYLRQHRGTFTLHGKNVSHIGFEGRTLVAREIYHMPNLSENVAAASNAGSNPVPSLIALMKNSTNDRKNLVDDWTHVGVGVVVDPNGLAFSTVLFSTLSLSQMSTRQRFNGF